MAQNLELVKEPAEFIMFWGWEERRGEGRGGEKRWRIREGRDCVRWRDGRGKRCDVVSSKKDFSRSQRGNDGMRAGG